eukprot:scaffold2277_cov256-Pinguiococcus_pyrenoidosus.AAC.18
MQRISLKRPGISSLHLFKAGVHLLRVHQGGNHQRHLLWLGRTAAFTMRKPRQPRLRGVSVEAPAKQPTECFHLRHKHGVKRLLHWRLEAERTLEEYNFVATA